MNTVTSKATPPTQTPPPLHALADALHAALPAAHTLAIAFSGGMDSRFLAFAARTLGLPVHLWHCTGPHLAPAESTYARRWAHEHAFACTALPCNPLELPEVAANSPQRCYVCKKALFTTLQAALPPQTVLCDGSNASDAAAHRPGRRALAELGVCSPLADAGLTKAAIYDLAAVLGLDNPSQKPRPCLLTRLPYHTPVSTDLLAALAAGEAAVQRVLTANALAGVDFRLRVVASGQCALHVPADALSEISPTVRDALTACVADTAPALGTAVIEGVTTLSGFFDTTPPNTLASRRQQ